MGAADAQIENLFGSKKPVKNPLVPIGALMTAGVLTAGLVSFRQGNSQLGQKLMRARVVFQGATVALMVGSAYYYVWQEELQQIKATSECSRSPKIMRSMLCPGGATLLMILHITFTT
ncbi:RING-H2 finger protein [Musa troglodytarum]|uniref:RING-H2 finger protein n=1 Tax=Musa troglodytarum TaxID=320322 RepID=A0A9E7KMC9_9LILI|nr:RING-H2 finger protein [Musa troglodytarum]